MMALLKMALLLFAGLQGCDALRATGDVCQDCTQIFELLADLFSNAELQKKMMDGIESLCDHLPGPATAARCKEEVEKMLPLKPAEVCKVFGFCGSCDKQEKMLSYLVKEALQVAAKRENVQPAILCSFCVFLIKSLEDMLPKESTEEAVIKLLEEICHILPSSYRDQCEAVIGRFSKTVLDAILSYAAPRAVCALIQLCQGQEAPLVDPCTLATYRCRDVTTALKCGTLFYCQKFAWKPLNTL